MPESRSEILVDSLRLMMRPLVRFAIRRAIKLQEFIECLKVVFLEVAKDELTRVGELPSSSRLSVMTGVHRRDVARIHTEGGSFDRTPNIIGKIVGQWQNDRRFLGKERKPKLLSFEGVESDFFRLVRSVSSDMNPYTVLFEMERSGLAKRTDRGLQLCANMFLSKGNVREALTLLAADLNDLHCAVEDNIERKGKELNLHIKTEYDNIIHDKLPEIRAWLLKRGSEIQCEVREYLSLFDKDINHKLSSHAGGARVAVGCFSFCEIVNSSDN